METTPHKTPDDVGGLIAHHGRGIGTPTLEAVEDRAREIAQTEGRAGDSITDEDLERATLELHDADLPLSSDDARSDVVATSNPADMAVETGHQIPDMRPTDEQQLSERDVKEGIREAEHERMLEGQDIDEDLD